VNTDRATLTPASTTSDRPPDPPVVVDRFKPPADTVIDKFNGSLEDAFFPYDRAELTSDALAALARDAQLLAVLLADFPHVKIVAEGHCDERGSAEYNLALGDRRARQAVDILRGKGVPESNLQILSYGKEMPACEQPTESCWQRNRRVHFSASRE
jgi:peptidoglycan-associated lipoprotein